MAAKRRWWSKLWHWLPWGKERAIRSAPFREFVYLDDISVISLLVSREGELTEQIQEGWGVEDTTGSESGLNIGVKDVSGFSAKSSFQTKSSQSIQATRKANIQSQFGRLLKRVREADLVFPDGTGSVVKKPEKIFEDSKVAIRQNQLTRGKLVELEVELSADPWFNVSAMITEMASMSEEHSEIIGDTLGAVSGDMRSFARLLDRFMAGLVPIRSKVLNVGICEYAGKDYIVDKAKADGLDLVIQDIELVAVLEKDRFWKDMRRVLFSGGSVHVLARVSVPGIQEQWTPVKLLDLFSKTFPNGNAVVSAFQSIDFEQASSSDDGRQDAFGQALTHYAVAWVSESDVTLTEAHQRSLSAAIEANRDQFASSESRLRSFKCVADVLKDAGVDMDSERDAEIRDDARRRAGLDVFGELVAPEAAPETPPNSTDGRLLEVEVVAMYW